MTGSGSGPGAKPAGDKAAGLSTRLPLDQIDNPEFGLVLQLWLKKRGDRIAPARGDFDPAELKPVLPRLLLIEVVPGEPVDFRYRLAGTQSYDIHGIELTGRRISELEPPGFVTRLRQDLLELMQRPEPQYVRVDFTNREGNTRSLRVMRLPLSSDGRVIDMFLIVQDFGADPARLQQIMREVMWPRD